ncbi:MAG TPA: UDP-N-acetylglucosamine--N-acetylmuramyl-(pentapeptide) pyrophosphoryl-undecaprenol N-acetylglucosamine transferase [Gemmatimonadaceae bacterium]|nr:UDP-N-acetylglucosamine--N-acetylmuramyl-(pentapeptide) pyrophosphoryl-undecaprenol N-acetylglucosamine transferase [Gemmatimonadaceae bacterium]
MRVVFTGGGTGGHLYPALAIARALCALRPDVEPFFIGATRGIERRVLPETGFPHQLLELHPLYRARPWQNWRTLGGLARAWRVLDRTLATAPPAFTVGTGGYAASATLGWCVAKRLPFALQEQNSFPGQTIRLFSRWAREIYLGFPEAAARLPRAAIARAVTTGNPVQPPPEPRPVREEARWRWGLPAGGPVVLVFGGSQGSAALNALVDGWITRGLPDGVSLIWATGGAHYTRHASRASARVVVREYLSPIADAYAAADLALTRAGAMTTAELCAWGIPALLVPLPTAAADHQTANARSLAEAGAARWIPEREATPERIADEIGALLRNPAALHALAQGAARRARPDAARDIATRVARWLDARMPAA